MPPLEHLSGLAAPTIETAQRRARAQEGGKARVETKFARLHNRGVERFDLPQVIHGRYASADGPSKTFLLGGSKDSTPDRHDGRLLTLEDTVEFFPLVPGLKCTNRRRKTW